MAQKKKDVDYNYTIFEYFAEQHNLTLLEGEINDIVHLVNSALITELQAKGAELQAAVNQYNAVVQQNKELQQELIQKNNKLMGKDAKIASMAIGCEPVIMEAACSFVNSLYTLFETEKTTIFNFSEETIAELKKIGRGLQDYQNNKPNPFSDEYFKNLTYSEIAELAKKSIRLTKEHCSDLHKIEELQQECEKLSYNLGTHIMIKNGYCRVLDMIEKYCSNAQDPCQDDWNREREKFAKIILNFISKVKGGKNE